MAVQENGESIDCFVNRLRSMIKLCGYKCTNEDCAKDLSDEFLLDRLCISISNVRLREKLYDDKQITLQDAIDKIKTANLTELQLRKLTVCEENSEEGNRLRTASKPANTDDKYGNFSRERNDVERTDKRQYQDNSDAIMKYFFCGYARNHDKKNCPAVGKQCTKCRKFNHFAKACQSNQNRVKNVQALRQIENECENVNNDNELKEYVYQINSDNNEGATTTSVLEFLVCEDVKQVKCQLDTAASCSVIGIKNLSEMLDDTKPRLAKTPRIIKAFGNGTVIPLGRFTLQVLRNGHAFPIKFEVVQQVQLPLISSRECHRLGLIKVCNKICANGVNLSSSEQILQKYDDVFKGMGKINYQVSLEIDKNVIPVIHKPRRVPVAYRQQLKQQIDELIADGIISKVDTHTDWVSNIVLVRRNGKMRICLDPTELNKAFKRPNYQMPTVEEILPELARAKVFSTVDATRGFWQLPLDHDSSMLTTFWTPFGRFRWNRMPFGISPAPEIFQRVQHELIDGLDGVECIHDHLLVYGCGETVQDAIVDHDKKLEQLLRRLREKILKLNRQKVKLCQNSVQFFGHLLTANGIEADPSKIAAIRDMPAPTNVSQVRTFLGSITYLSKFLPNLSSVAEPIRKLTKDEAEFEWGDEQQRSFRTLKHLVTRTPVLLYFDSKLPIVLQCDASSMGLGSVLLQDGKPVAFASRTLTGYGEKLCAGRKRNVGDSVEVKDQ